MTKLELLAPARTADIGIEAIRHGADAVYIGAPRFGARAAAGNTIDDIRRLVRYAHQFRARVYVTVNTIFTDDELPAVVQMIRGLYEAQVDALIVQDMSLLRLTGLPPIPMHASTQMDNRTPEKVRWLRSLGFRQVVLARELTLGQIRQIHQACPDTRLEVFVHGALCVSLSGRCYASQCLFRRSANRGECAQVCRMEWNLETVTPDGKTVTLLRDRHLLSLRDLCQLESLPDLISAGATSFKIEGRLKDMAYVKNVTAAYSQALNRIVRAHPDQYERASDGLTEYYFKPDVHKSFNRGFTNYFLHGRTDGIFSLDTPKSIGEEVGRVKDIGRGWFTVAGISKFANGDGLCYIDSKGRLFGFRVNRVDDGRLYPLEMPKGLEPKMRLYRNFDKAFDDLLHHDSAQRYIPVDITIGETPDGFRLTLTDDYGTYRSIDVQSPKELARTHQTENIERQMSRLGDTIYRLRTLTLDYRKNWFIPSSQLSEWRRQLVAGETSPTTLTPQLTVPGTLSPLQDSEDGAEPGEALNVYNTTAREFYADQGIDPVPWAYEREAQADQPVMTCKHCIRYALGWCPKNERRSQTSESVPRHDEALNISNSAGRFRLQFDCKNCVMNLYKA